MADVPELEEAFSLWLPEASELLGSDPSYVVEQASAPSWQIDQDQKLRFRSRTYRVWTRAALDRAFSLPSAENVRTALAGFPAIAEQLGKVVGTESGSGSLLTADYLLSHLLPKPHQLELSITNSQYFAEKYREIERFLLSEDAFCEVRVWVLGGVKFDTYPVQLADNVWLDRLTDSELTHAYDFDLVSHSFPRELPLTPDLYDCLRSCIRFVRPAARAIGEDVGRSAIAKGQEVADMQERVLQTLPLSDLRGAVVTGHLAYVAGQLHISGWQYAKLRAVQNIPFPTTSSDTEALTIQRAWGLLTTVPEGRRGSGLNLAIRRLSFLTDRARPEDRILDLMIAAEAFYLTGIDSTTELSFRLSLRAAVLSILQGSSATAARTTFDLFRTAYGARSKVAHGADLQSYLAKKNVGVDEFVVRLTDAVRGAILGALQSLSHGEVGHWTPNCDDDLFELLGRGLDRPDATSDGEDG